MKKIRKVSPQSPQ